VLQNDETADLTTTQIAAHLHTKIWNVTRELQLGAQRKPGRLRGNRATNSGPGRGGPWVVNRQVYLNWLGIPEEDRNHLGPDKLPELIPLSQAASALELPEEILRTMIRQARWPHVTFGRNRYLTHNQLDRIRVQLAKTAGG
jgi:hypothetical protein